eukprot:c1028_g1_i1 orf=309-533(+)
MAASIDRMAYLNERPAFLKIEDGVLLTSEEAENIVQNLHIFDIEEIGTLGWITQNEKLQKLNYQVNFFYSFLLE